MMKPLRLLLFFASGFAGIFAGSRALNIARHICQLCAALVQGQDRWGSLPLQL
jgi:hypothetical protein